MRNEIIVSKMLSYIEKVQKYSESMTYDTFIENELVAEACVFNLGQLGELANKADMDFRRQHSEIPWSQIYGLRNRIVHDYEGGEPSACLGDYFRGPAGTEKRFTITLNMLGEQYVDSRSMEGL